MPINVLAEDHWYRQYEQMKQERDAARARAERAEAVVVRFPMPSGHMFTYDEQLKMMAEMNGWKTRAEKAEAERDDARAKYDLAHDRIYDVEAECTATLVKVEQYSYELVSLARTVLTVAIPAWQRERDKVK